MSISVETVSAPQMGPWRDQYRQEMNCQIIHDSLHTREGWTQTYLLRVGQEIAGYGSVAVSGPWKEQPTIFEFYLVPRYRQQMFVIFAALVESTAVRRVETQTNDMLLATLLHAMAPSVSSESILFHDQRTSSLVIPDAMVRPAAAADSAAVAAANLDAEARWVLVERDNIVGTGGILFHYNRPYGDIYMQIAEPSRRRGLGSFMVQELKSVCYQMGSTPAARCNPDNIASRTCLQKAGFVPCGCIITGFVAP